MWRHSKVFFKYMSSCTNSCDKKTMSITHSDIREEAKVHYLAILKNIWKSEWVIWNSSSVKHGVSKKIFMWNTIHEAITLSLCMYLYSKKYRVAQMISSYKSINNIIGHMSHKNKIRQLGIYHVLLWPTVLFCWQKDCK